MITLETSAGLANRMRAVASAVSLARKYETGLKVIWPRNNALNCDFNSLFLPIKGVEVCCSSLPIWYFDKIIAKIKYKHAYLSITMNNNAELIEAISKGHNVYINTFSQFFDVDSYKCFRPTSQIEAKVNKLLPEDSSNLIGIHIRRGDNQKSISMSPTQLFIDSIRLELMSNPKAKFYLATDSKQDEERLISIFGDKIITNKNKEFSRRVGLGIEDALVDLICLSKTEKIFGSYWSSFSETAAIMGKEKEIKILVIE